MPVEKYRISQPGPETYSLPLSLAASIAAAVPAAASSMRSIDSGSGSQEKPHGVRMSCEYEWKSMKERIPGPWVSDRRIERLSTAWFSGVSPGAMPR